jgi:integrase
MATIKPTRNPNHPKLGSTIKVDPIRNKRDIATIKKMLTDRPRDLALFTLGINTNLRASDLLRIKVGQVRGLKPGDEITLKEKKTGKSRRITLNKAVISAVNRLLKTEEYLGSQSDDYLFKSQRAPVLRVQSVHRLVKS